MNVEVVGMRRQTFQSKVLRRVSSPGGVVWSGAGAAAAHVGGSVPGITFHLLSVLASQDAMKGVWDAIPTLHPRTRGCTAMGQQH